MIRRARRLLLLLVLAFALTPGRAIATKCPPIAGAVDGLAEIDAEARLAFVQGGLREAARKARLWSWGWTATHLGMTAIQLATMPLFPKQTYIDRYVGAGASLVGIATLWLVPMRVMFDSPRLDKRVAAAGTMTEAETCELLAEAEAFMVRDAQNENRVRSWWPHAATLAFGAALGVTLSLAFDRREQGAILGIASMTLGELRLGTQPRTSVDLLRAYRAGSMPRASTGTPVTWAVSPAWLPGPNGGGMGAQALLIF